MKDLDEFDRRLNQPIGKGKKPNPEAVARDMDDFAQFAAAFGVTPDSTPTA